MVEITQGEDKNIIIRLNNLTTKDPFDFTGLTEAKVCFVKIDGTNLDILLSAPTPDGSQLSVLGSALLGKLTLLLNDADTALFKVVDIATMELTLDFGTDKRKISIPNAYQVIASQC